MKIPEFVDAVLAEFENRTEPFNEAQVYDALRIARQSHGDLTEDEFKGFRGEASAFFFYERRDRDSPWNTYFAPTFTATQADGTVVFSPDIKELDADVVAYWETRGRTSKNPVLRARYADLVWDLVWAITGQRPNVDYARIAIDSYLEAAERGFYTMAVEGIQWCERALDLALSISDKERVNRVIDFMFAFYEGIAKPQHTGTWLFLFDDLYGKRDLITPEQGEQIIANLETMLAKVSNRENKEAFNPWGAEEAAERLATHYTRRRDQENAKRVVKSYGTAFENLAREASPLLAMAWLQPVLEKYQQAGLKEEAERVQLASLEKAKNVKADLKEVSVQVEIKREELDAYLEQITAGDLSQAILRVAVRFIPDLNDARAFLAETAQQYPLQALIKVVKVADSQIVAQAGSVEDDAEGRLHMQLAQNIQISQFFLVRALARLRERYQPTVEQLMDFLYESPVFDDFGRDLFGEGLLAYEKEDFVKAIHVLIPRIEHAMRNLLNLLGIPVNKPIRGQPAIMQLKNVNDILADERVRASLGESLWRYLQVLLADKRGLNLRNRVAHGLLRINDFNRPVADQIFHAMLALSLIRKET